MNSIRKKAIAEDLRKVGTTAVAAALCFKWVDTVGPRYIDDPGGMK